MSVIIHDKPTADRLVAERRAKGLDARDEVWEGVYVVSPLAGYEHQFLAMKLAGLLDRIVGETGRGVVFQGFNVSDRDQGWTDNFRIPDIAVFLNGGVGILHDTHAEGGPDFLVEILSEDDPAPEKLPFYARNGVKECLLIRREPDWAVELHRNDGDALRLVQTIRPGDPEPIVCREVPLALRLIPAAEAARPSIEAVQTDGDLKRVF